MREHKNKGRGAVIVAIGLTSVPFKKGTVNGSGISKYVYFIQSNDILRWPRIAENIGDAESDDEYVAYDGDFEINPDAKWIRIYNTQGEGVVVSDSIGDKDSRLFLNKLSYRFPKLTGPALVLANSVVNGEGVFVAWHDGAYRVIGDKHYGCTVNPNVRTGAAAGDSKGFTFEASCPSHKSMPVYNGILPLEDGILYCDTDTFINYNDMNTNYTKEYDIEGGNTVRLDALSMQGRMHLEGEGDISVGVSVDGATYQEVDHEIAFENGVAIVPVTFIVGDKVTITATTLTKCIINWNDVIQEKRK